MQNWNPNHMHVPHPRQSHSFLPIKKKNYSWAGFPSAPKQAGLPPILLLENGSSYNLCHCCVHAACKTPNTPETAEVICTLNLDLGAWSTIKCVPGQTSQPESLWVHVCFTPLWEEKGGCWVDKDYWHIWGFNKVRLHRTARAITGTFPKPRYCSVNLPLYTQRILLCHSICSFCCSPSCHPSHRFLLKQVEGEVEGP